MAGRVTYLAQLRRENLPPWNEGGGNVIAGVELVTPGPHNGYPFTKEMVKQIAVNTRLLEQEAGYEPPWVVGHGDEMTPETGARTTMGYWRNWKMGTVGVEADLEVINQWDWERIGRGELRYLSIECPWSTVHPKTSVVLGPSIQAVACVDVPAVRSAALFRDGAEPINLRDFPELVAQLGRGGKTKMSKWQESLHRVGALLGLGQNATEEEVAAATEQRLRENASRVDSPETAVLRQRATAAETQLAQEREQRAAEVRRVHGERVTAGLAALRDGGRVPPAVCDRLAPVLAGMEPTLVVRLGEGAEARDASPADEILAALGELPAIVLREGTARTTVGGEVLSDSDLTRIADKAR